MKAAHMFLYLIAVIGCSFSRLAQPEPQRIATEKVEQVLTRCGDTYVAGIYATVGVLQDKKQLHVHQWKPAVVGVAQRPLTEADRENGFEWKGSVGPAAKTYRFHRGAGWSSWVTANEMNSPGGWLIKKDGRWELYIGESSPLGDKRTGLTGLPKEPYGPLQKIDCSAVPKN